MLGRLPEPEWADEADEADKADEADAMMPKTSVFVFKRDYIMRGMTVSSGGVICDAIYMGLLGKRKYQAIADSDTRRYGIHTDIVFI